MKATDHLHICLLAAAIFIAASLTLVPPARATSQFTEGFRGIAWHTHKDQLPDLGLTSQSLGKIYPKGPSSVLFMEGKGNLALDFAGIPLLSIFLHFDNQRFSGVDMLFNGENRAQLLTELQKENGPPEPSSDTMSQWLAESVDITLTDRELMVRPRSGTLPKN